MSEAVPLYEGEPFLGASIARVSLKCLSHFVHRESAQRPNSLLVSYFLFINRKLELSSKNLTELATLGHQIVVAQPAKPFGLAAVTPIEKPTPSSQPASFGSLHSIHHGEASQEDGQPSVVPSDTVERCNLYWLSIILLLRSFALVYLQKLYELHTESQNVYSYWEWATTHPSQHLVHRIASSWVFASLYLLHSKESVRNGARSAAIASMRRLGVFMAAIVESIGRVHAALQSMVASVEALCAVIDQGDSVVFGPAEGANEAAMPEKPLGAPLDLECDLQAIVVKLLCGFDLPDSESTNAAAALLREPSLCMEETLSALHCDTSTLLQTPSQLQRSAEEPAQLAAHAVFVFHRCQSWLAALKSTIVKKECPPRGRHAMRIVKYAFTASLFGYVLLRSSPSKLREYCRMGSTYGLAYFNLYCITPLVDLFRAFVTRPPEAMSLALVQNDLQTLANMVQSYLEDMRVAPQVIDDAVQKVHATGDIGIISKHYETAIRHPIRNAVFSHLWRLMLIQIQKQKVDLNRVLVSSDQVLAQNDFSFRMMAVAPPVLLVGFAFAYTAMKSSHEQRPVIIKMKRCFRDLHRVVARAEREPTAHTSGTAASVLSPFDHGCVIIQVHQLRVLALTLAASNRRSLLRPWSWLYTINNIQTLPLLWEDLDDVEDVRASRSERLHTLQRMYLTHDFLQARRELSL